MTQITYMTTQNDTDYTHAGDNDWKWQFTYMPVLMIQNNTDYYAIYTDLRKTDGNLQIFKHHLHNLNRTKKLAFPSWCNQKVGGGVIISNQRQSYFFMRSHVGDGGGLDNGLVDAFHQDPVTCWHPVHLHFVPVHSKDGRPTDWLLHEKN